MKRETLTVWNLIEIHALVNHLALKRLQLIRRILSCSEWRPIDRFTDNDIFHLVPVSLDCLHNTFVLLKSFS